MDDALAPLLTPFRLGSLELRNRVGMAPMTRRQSPNGVPDAAVAEYYRRRAEGGVAFVVTEGTTIDRPASAPYTRVPNMHDPEALRGWAAVLAGVHGAGAHMICQLWHAGPLRRAEESPSPDAVTESASGLDGAGGQVGQAASEEDLADIAASYARAAMAAQRTGFDAVEVHCAHGYLLDSFLWEASNRRHDRWGGRTPAARAGFPAEVVRQIRMAVGPDYPIVARFSQWKTQDFSARLWRSPADLEEGLRPFIDAGVDGVHCSTRRFWDPEYEGDPLSLAGWVKRLFDLPTIAVGSVGLREDFMSAFQRTGSEKSDLLELSRRMARGEFDLIAVGRALLADPYWFAKTRDGRLSELADLPPDAIDRFR